MLVPHNNPKTEGVSKSDMNKFDSILLRAAESKRKEITERYGPDACAKVLAKGKDAKKEQDTELKKKNYESTIRNLLESWETSPRDQGRTTKNIDKIINSAWEWNISTTEEANKQKKRPSVKQSVRRSRRHSLEV